MLNNTTKSSDVTYRTNNGRSEGTTPIGVVCEPFVFFKGRKGLKVIIGHANVKPRNPKHDCGLDKIEDD